MHYNFLIYISYSYAVPIGNPLEAEILKQGYTVKWFADINEGKNAIKNKTNTLQTIKEVIDYKPDIVLTATDNVPDFITGLKVQIFHGFLTYKRPKKNRKEAHFNLRGFFDLYCTQGPSTTQVFLEQQKKQPYFEVIETGWSKVDPLFPIQQKNKEKVPTVLIASTFTERLSLAYNNEVYLEIEKLSNAGVYQFITVLHPKMPKAIVDKWKSIDNDYFTFYDTTDLIPLYKKADIMFADTTSAIQEFLLQKKPVVTFHHTIKHNYLIHIEAASEIESSIKKALTYPEELLKNISIFIEQLHPYFDGKSSERIVNTTISFLHKDKSYLKQKPLNLIRKYKMRKRLNYFTLKSYNKAYTLLKNDD